MSDRKKNCFENEYCKILKENNCRQGENESSKLNKN